MGGDGDKGRTSPSMAEISSARSDAKPCMCTVCAGAGDVGPGAQACEWWGGLHEAQHGKEVSRARGPSPVCVHVCEGGRRSRALGPRAQACGLCQVVARMVTT